MVSGSGNYAAGDASEMRKNPSLYSDNAGHEKATDGKGRVPLRKPEVLAPAGNRKKMSVIGI
jgi:hypothetical protein